VFSGLVRTSYAIDTGNKPRIAFAVTELDAGLVAPEAETSHTFVFENVGKGPLIISSVSSSCNCSTVVPLEKPIAPGERDEIKITIKHGNTAAKYEYIFAAKSNDPETPLSVLKIRAEVVPQFTVIPRRVFLGDLQTNEPAQSVIRLAYLKGPDGWTTEILDVTSSSDDVTVTYDDSFVGKINHGKVRLRFEGRDTAGAIAETITIRTSNLVLPTVTIPVEGRVVGNIVAAPSRFHTGFVEPDTEWMVTLSLWQSDKTSLPATPTVHATEPLDYIGMLKRHDGKYQLRFKIRSQERGRFSSAIRLDAQVNGSIEIPVQGFILKPPL